MGYSTTFTNRFMFNKKLPLDDYLWLVEFNEKDHRNEPYCPDYGFYCQWVPSKDGMGLEWDEGEKFYGYIEWLKYLITKFFEPKGYILNGEVAWEGEEQGDLGVIVVKDNKVSTKRGKVVYEYEDDSDE